MTQYCNVPGEPKGKGRPRFSRGHAYTPQTTRDYEELIAHEYKRQCNYQFQDDANISLKVTAHFGIPKNVSKKVRNAMLTGEIMPTKKPDADNILKIVADALNGIAYSDDKQIVAMRVSKWYSYDGFLEISLSEVET